MPRILWLVAVPPPLVHLRLHVLPSWKQLASVLLDYDSGLLHSSSSTQPYSRSDQGTMDTDCHVLSRST